MRKCEVLMVVLILFLDLGLCCIIQRHGAVQEAQADCSPIEIKRVALTFDDGPHPVYTKVLLDGLKKRQVRATFFVVGIMAEKCPGLVLRMVEDGHLIGNHTYHHTDIKQTCDSICVEEIKENQELIKSLTGYEMEFLRPPYGDWDKKTKLPVPLFCVEWDVDPLDWNCCSADVVANRVLEKVKDGDIILLHDTYESSVQAAFHIIDQLKEEGYEFVTVEELLLD